MHSFEIQTRKECNPLRSITLSTHLLIKNAFNEGNTIFSISNGSSTRLPSCFNLIMDLVVIFIPNFSHFVKEWNVYVPWVCRLTCAFLCQISSSNKKRSIQLSFNNLLLFLQIFKITKRINSLLNTIQSSSSYFDIRLHIAKHISISIPKYDFEILSFLLRTYINTILVRIPHFHKFERGGKYSITHRPIHQHGVTMKINLSEGDVSGRISSVYPIVIVDDSIYSMHLHHWSKWIDLQL